MIEGLEKNLNFHALLGSCLLAFFFIISFYLNIFHIIFLLLYFIFYEILIIGIYFSRYKGSYKNKLYSPILVNHNLYGYGFPEKFNSKTYNKLLFEKYLFKSNRISENLDQNISDRIVLNINNGFRSDKISANKYKIFCCGGSTTACDSCDDNETWPYFLEKKIESDSNNFQVINAGTQGWYSYQDLLKIKNEILNHNPKIIILHQGWNEEFEFASQNLGRDWQPRAARDFIAANITYTRKKQTSLLNRLCSIFLIKRLYYFFYKFKIKMSFTNPSRWSVLKNNKYLDAWFDVLIEIVHLANERSILIYMINPPCLVDIEDSKMNREIYLENSRLDKWFANYQSISSERITHFLSKINTFIPVIDTMHSFKKYSGLDRLRYFIDEIHLSPAGNEVMSEFIYLFLKKDHNFQAILQDNLNYQKIDINSFLSLKNEAITNSNQVNKLIDININSICTLKPNSKNAIPRDRYTTF